jgi:capsular polysaccharide biosynthesis protein
MTDLTIAAVEVARSEIQTVFSNRVARSPQLDQFVHRSPARYIAPEIRFSAPQPLFVTGDKFTVLAERSGLVPGSTYLFNEYEWRGLFEPHRAILPLPDQTVLVAGNAGWRNYSHWLFQCFPPLLLAPQVGLGETHAIVPPLNAVQRELLAYAGWDSRRYTELPVEAAALPRYGVYTNLTGGDFPFLPHPAIAAPFETLAAQAPRSAFAGQRVFLSRADARKRVMINDAELTTALEKEGYTIVTPGALSAREQIALFRDAALLVGQHGAAFTNLLFSPCGKDGPVVVELHQENYPASAFVKLCQAKGLSYTAIFSRMIDAGADGRHDSTWEADIPLILETLAKAHA